MNGRSGPLDSRSMRIVTATPYHLIPQDGVDLSRAEARSDQMSTEPSKELVMLKVQQRRIKSFVVLLVALIAFVMPVSMPQALADAAPTPAPSIIESPWGCEASSDNPHPSDTNHGHINAYSHIKCTQAPSGVKWVIEQQLYRSSYQGWVQVASKSTQCNPKVGDPLCYSTRMRSVISWQCVGFNGSWFNYRITATHSLVDGNGNVLWAVSTWRQTGNWWETGNTFCP